MNISNSKGNQLKSDEYVLFLPDIAYLKDDVTIYAGVQGWVYEKEHRLGLTHLFTLFLGIDLSKLSPSQRHQFYERTQLFRVDSERGKRLVMKDQNNKIFDLSVMRSNGRISALLEVGLSSQQTPREIAFELHQSGNPALTNRVVAFYAPKTRFSIISDIDDTIKESSVGDTSSY